LTFSSAPLEQPLEVTGPLTINLWASTSAVDTDFVVRLCDVWPDGISRLLAEGILRARYRDGFEQPVWLQPGRVYLFKIDLVATSNVFMPGHQIRVDVMSSSWPRFNVNPNITSSLGAYSGSDLTPALQTIFHDGNYPSHIILPVISGRRASEVI
jgi:putative CocE/NonD family hydrolase